MTHKNPNLRANPGEGPDPNAKPNKPAPDATPSKPSPGQFPREVFPSPPRPAPAPVAPEPEKVTYVQPRPAPKPKPEPTAGIKPIAGTTQAFATDWANDLLGGVKPVETAPTPEQKLVPEVTGPTQVAAPAGGWIGDEIKVTHVGGGPEAAQVIEPSAPAETSDAEDDAFLDSIKGKAYQDLSKEESQRANAIVKKRLGADKTIAPITEQAPKAPASKKTAPAKPKGRKAKAEEKAKAKGKLDILAESTDPAQILEITQGILDDMLAKKLTPNQVAARIKEVEPNATEEAKVGLRMLTAMHRNWTGRGREKTIGTLTDAIMEARRAWGDEAARPFYAAIADRLGEKGRTLLAESVQHAIGMQMLQENGIPEVGAEVPGLRETGYVDTETGEVVQTTVPEAETVTETPVETAAGRALGELADDTAELAYMDDLENRQSLRDLQRIEEELGVPQERAKMEVNRKLDEADAEAAAAKAARAAEVKAKLDEADRLEAERVKQLTPAKIIEGVLDRLGRVGPTPDAWVMNLQDRLDEMEVEEIEALAKVISERPKSKIRISIEENIARIFDFLFEANVPLSGDHPVKRSDGKVVNEHSERVENKILETLHFLGFEPGSESEKWLFRAFLVYRGIATDRGGHIFNKTIDQFEINDAVFIEFLDEMCNNIRTHNHPFAYTNPHCRIGGVERFPAMMTVGLAEWFARSDRIDDDAAGLMAYSIEQHENDVLPRMDALADRDQFEAWLDINDTVASQENHPGEPRGLDDRIAASEMRDAGSLAARLFNSEQALVDNMKKRQARERLARKRMDRKAKRGGYNSKPKTPSETNDHATMWEGAYAKVSEFSVAKLLRAITGIMRFSRIIGMPMLAPTGFVEKGTGVLNEGLGTKFLRGFMGGEMKPTEATVSMVQEQHNIDAYEDLVRILITLGWDGVIDAAARGVDFEHVKNTLPAEMLSLAMKVTTGDVGWKKATMRVFIDHYIYQLERKAKLAEQNGAWDLNGQDVVRTTPEQVEAWLTSNPKDFWREVALSEEGRAALRFAANTSLGGIDPITNALRQMTSNAYVDFALSVALSPFLKFGVRELLRIVPFSSPMVYAATRGINAAGMHMGLLTEEQAQDGNSYMLAGDESFWRGMAQNTIADIPRFGYQLTVVTAIGLVSMFGLEAPDDDDDEEAVDKRFLWYEYKICGKAIKTNWYWNEILGFAMPFVVAANVAADGDMELAEQIFWNGVFEQINENPWMNAIGMVDMVGNWDRELIEAQARADGYETSKDISDLEFFMTQFMTWGARTTAATFEPAVVRQVYNDSTLFMGTPDLRRSAGRVWTTTPGETRSDGSRDTKQTSWFDYQLRKETMKSPLLGAMANLAQGVFNHGEDVAMTGYQRSQMPLVSIQDPIQQNSFEELSVRDPATGQLVTDPDKWTDEQRVERVNTVLRYLKKYDAASDIAAQGIVIPYEARHWTVVALYEQKNAIEAEFRHKDEEGKWDWVWATSTPEERGDLKAARNKAWTDKEEKKAAVQKKIDLLFDDEIPYKPMAYNQWEGNWRVIRTWKPGTPRAGQPATQLDELIFGDKIATETYHAGDHKSSFAPWLTVDDQGAGTYDAQTQAGWQTPATDLDFVRSENKGDIVAQGFNKGKDVWDIASGEGGAYAKATEGGPLQPKLLAGARALVPAEVPVKKLERDDYKKLDVAPATKTTKDTTPQTYRRRGGWSSGGGYVPAIYSHPAYNLNADKPAGLFSKTPSYTRFDYLRPRVATKGSREAYRREDF